MSGESITLNYSDILYCKLPEKNRLFLLMRNDDTFDIYGKDLQLCLRDLEDRLVVALAESHSTEAEYNSAWVQSITSVSFQVPAMRKIGTTMAATAPYANSSRRFDTDF
jgi:hypothetical protein